MKNKDTTRGSKDMVEYTRPVDPDADLMTRGDWLDSRRQGYLTNDDGIGYPCRDGLMGDIPVCCHLAYRLPDEATHVAWFGK